ncbi:MAG: hypothetical protein ACYC6Y_14540 [Thermoguttaceae bacterium]
MKNLAFLPFLAALLLAPAAFPALAGEPLKPFTEIELYAPGHFGNSYEAMGEYEMEALIDEAKSWGCNGYGDWFDMLDCSDPFRAERQADLSRALWNAKKANFRAAARLGLTTDFLFTPNHVYVDQRAASVVAKAGGRAFGQLVCPSDEAARKMILDDYRRLFADLAASGVQLDRICSCPYDYGGCNCTRCQPWILTWGRLVRDIYDVAREHHPKVETVLVGWWWDPEEHRQLAEWVDREHSGWIKAMYLHIPYGKTGTADVVLPKGCARGAFVHIGYADQASPRDLYGLFGPMIASERIPQTLRELEAQGVTHLMAYSEGVCDDVNKALYAGLASGQYASASEVLEAYAARHFGTDQAASRQWAAWLARWGTPFTRDAAEAQAELKTLLTATPRSEARQVQEWVLKTELFRLHREIEATGKANGGQWTPERLQLVDDFWRTRERIQRGLWGLAPQRHIFARGFFSAEWYKSWSEHVGHP